MLINDVNKRAKLRQEKTTTHVCRHWEHISTPPPSSAMSPPSTELVVPDNVDGHKTPIVPQDKVRL